MAPRVDPQLEGEARRERSDRAEMIVARDEAPADLRLLADDPAKDALAKLAVEPLATIQLFIDLLGDDRCGHDLGVGMTERSSGLPAFVLEDMDILVLVFLFYASHPLLVCGQDILEVCEREVREFLEMGVS